MNGHMDGWMDRTDVVPCEAECSCLDGTKDRETCLSQTFERETWAGDGIFDAWDGFKAEPFYSYSRRVLAALKNLLFFKPFNTSEKHALFTSVEPITLSREQMDAANETPPGTSTACIGPIAPSSLCSATARICP